MKTPPMKTERAYYHNPYLKEFTAQILESVPAGKGFSLYLDRTAFYPESGGQPADRGWIGDVPLLDVVDEGERIAHRVGTLPTESKAECRLDWDRRFDHMQQHSGQHILSAALERTAGYSTVSFHLGEGVSTIDLDSERVGARQLEAAEALVNQVIFENRPIRVSFRAAEEVRQLDLRKPGDRTEEVRLIEVEDFDLSACGGTHVSATGAVGVVLIRKTERRKGSTRVEFLCGGRAVRAARHDSTLLDNVARKFSTDADTLPKLVERHLRNLQAGEKKESRLIQELAGYQADRLLAEASEMGGRKSVRKIFEADDADRARAVARAIISHPDATVLFGTLTDPAGLILAQSPGGSSNMGPLLRQILERLGGKGGGSRDFAQGGGISPARLDEALRLAEEMLASG